jgi:hypothetical protein
MKQSTSICNTRTPADYENEWFVFHNCNVIVELISFENSLYNWLCFCNEHLESSRTFKLAQVSSSYSKLYN